MVITMILSEMKQDIYNVLCYTRLPINETEYAPKLAYSMHLAYSKDGVVFHELNHNSGILFAKATENSDGTLNAKSLKNPYIFYMADGTYGVIAVRIEADGTNDPQSKGYVLFFTSSDLLHYKEVGLIDLKGDTYVDDLKCSYDEIQKNYVIHWSDMDGNYYKNYTTDIANRNGLSVNEKAEAFAMDLVNSDIEGIVPRNMINVSKEVAHRLICKLTVPTNVSIVIPSKVTAGSAKELEDLLVNAVYSDGTTARKRIDWDTSNVCWSKQGEYNITGTVHQDHYEFPIATNRADPCIGKWNGKYYFIATNDADENHSLYIREADNIPDLVNAKEHRILDTTMYEHLGNLLWAPEFHIIGDDLYIFHAGTPGDFHKEQSHVMKLKKGGNPINKEDWTMPLRVVKKDGSYLYDKAGITLDMTSFEINNNVYIIWAQRQFFPVDQGSWLYIAEINKTEPWKLISDPVIISKPEYGWANNHVFVDEGPFPLITDKKIYISFASALIDETYVVGLLSADKDADLLNPDCWLKENYPLLTSRSIPGEYGPGHNAYVEDGDGNVWNTYHARPGINQPRSSGIRRVHFDIDGYPVLDLTEERDLNKDLAKVSTTLIVS
jgi:GH43 family beta-xylosidase